MTPIVGSVTGSLRLRPRLARPLEKLAQRPVALGGGHAHAGEATGQRVGSLEAHLDVVAREAGEPTGRGLARREHQHLLEAPDEPATEVEVLPARELTEGTGSLTDRSRADGGGEAGGLGPLPRRVREHVEVGERQLLDHANGLAEVPVALAGEPHD